MGSLKSNFGNGRDLNRSRDEAQRVLQEARQFDRIGRGRGVDGRVQSEWSQIQRELQIISDAYGLNYYNNGGYPGDRNNRNDDWRRNNPNNGNRNNDWWRRIPWPN